MYTQIDEESLGGEGTWIISREAINPGISDTSVYASSTTSDYSTSYWSKAEGASNWTNFPNKMSQLIPCVKKWAVPYEMPNSANSTISWGTISQKFFLPDIIEFGGDPVSAYDDAVGEYFTTLTYFKGNNTNSAVSARILGSSAQSGYRYWTRSTYSYKPTFSSRYFRAYYVNNETGAISYEKVTTSSSSYTYEYYPMAILDTEKYTDLYYDTDKTITYGSQTFYIVDLYPAESIETKIENGQFIFKFHKSKLSCWDNLKYLKTEAGVYLKTGSNTFTHYTLVTDSWSIEFEKEYSIPLRNYLGISNGTEITFIFTKLNGYTEADEKIAAFYGYMAENHYMTAIKQDYSLTATLTTPFTVEGDITLGIIALTGNFPSDIDINVQLTNNALDENPVWQDCTTDYKKELNTIFENTTTENGAAFNFKIYCGRGADSATKTDEIYYITSIQGAFQ